MEKVNKKVKVIDVGLATRYSEVFKETKMRIDFTFNSEVKGSLELRNFLAVKLEEFFNGTTK